MPERHIYTKKQTLHGCYLTSEMASDTALWSSSGVGLCRGALLVAEAGAEAVVIALSAAGECEKRKRILIVGWASGQGEH